MKTAVLTVLILWISLTVVCAQARLPKENDTLYWQKDYRLQATDFHGAAEPKSKFTAVSICPLICNYYTDSLTDTLCFQVYCFFDKKESWVKSAEADDDLLAHEQIHFDIVEIYTRILSRKLENYKREKNISEEGLLNIINRLLKEKDQTQILYDKETNLSRNTAQQKKWSDKVHELINKKQVERFN